VLTVARSFVTEFPVVKTLCKLETAGFVVVASAATTDGKVSRHRDASTA
jgi:hypothetical protein